MSCRDSSERQGGGCIQRHVEEGRVVDVFNVMSRKAGWWMYSMSCRDSSERQGGGCIQCLVEIHQKGRVMETFDVKITSGNTIWDRTLVGTVSEKNIFCLIVLCFYYI